MFNLGRVRIEELRESSYHQELGRKICAAYVAQQQGIKLGTADKKVPEPVGDLWLVLAELAEKGCSDNLGRLLGDIGEPVTASIM